jgi:hypothetical protein
MGLRGFCEGRSRLSPKYIKGSAFSGERDGPSAGVWGRRRRESVNLSLLRPGKMQSSVNVHDS